MRNTLLVFFALLLTATNAQDTLFYKDEYGQKEATRKQATYMQITTVRADTLRAVEYKHVKGGRMMWSRSFNGDRPVGKWQTFDNKGRLVTESDFTILVYANCGIHYEAPVKDSISPDSIIVSPQFPGGEEAHIRFLVENVDYPDIAQEMGIQGKVVIEGVVDEQGQWHTTAICKGAHPFLDLAAWRALEKMPKWSPGTINGRPVKVTLLRPISFRVM